MIQPFPHPKFNGGLNVRDQPDVVDGSQALDVLNVTFTERGALRQRDGYAKFTSVEGTNRYDSMHPFYTTGGTKHLICGAGNRLEAIGTDGAIVASGSTTLPTASPHYFARFGGPTGEHIYVSNGTDLVRRWTGTAWEISGGAITYTGTAPDGKFLAVTPWDNRLVNANRVGTTAGDNPSSVRFSAAGVPTTWGASDYIDLEPGDGEQITGMIAWRERLFVFKESKFFVFSSTSTSSTGTAVFNYYPVENGQGLVAAGALCVGRDGVYFLARDGVYRTTGGVGELVSGALDPLFRGETPDFFQSSTINQAQISKARMAFWQEQVFLSVPTGSSTTNNRVFVHDPRFGWWTLYDFPAAAMCTFRVSDNDQLMFAYATGTKDIGRHTTGLTTDAGVAIDSRWTSGWFDLGATTVKTLREFKVWGKGSVFFGVGRDFSPAEFSQSVVFAANTDTWGDGTGSDTWGDGTGSDTWGAGQEVQVQLVRRAVRGTVFSVTVADVSGAAWTVNRLAHHVREGEFATTKERD